MNTITCKTASLWLLAASMASTGTTTVLAQERGELLWSDEFDNTGFGTRPSSDVWSFDIGGGGWGNGELQVYTETTSNILVEDGLLKIIARKDDSSSPPTFTSARIKTEDKVNFKYGTLEARIKPPDMDAGLWPAFWTLGSDFKTAGWPGAGEIDIMELGQGLAIEAGLVNNRVVSAAHWEFEGDYATYAKWYDSPSDLTQDFHIYRLEWTPERMATYVDDALIWEMDIGQDVCVDCEELHQTHFILLNMAVGGGFTGGSSSSSSGGSSSSSSCAGSSSSAGGSSSGGCAGRGPEDITAPLPGELLVDWVRLYDNGFTEAEVPTLPAATPVPVTAAPITARPTDAPTTPAPVASLPAQPDPTNPPTRAPVASVPLNPAPTIPAPTNPPPTTTAPRQPDPPSPTTTAPRNPPTLPPQSASSFDGGDDDDYVDCFDTGSRSGSGSRSGGKSGKGGKSGGGKSGSRRRTRRRKLSSSKSKGKGGKGGGSSSGSSRSSGDCGGNGRVGQSSYLSAQSEISAASAVGPSMFIPALVSAVFMLYGFIAAC